MWKAPDRHDLTSVVASASSHLLICSPYIKGEGIELIHDALSPDLARLEIWTKLDINEYLLGASDPDALLQFLSDVVVPTKQIYSGDRLHAKFVLADSTLALAGSANITHGGFRSNIELIRVIDQPGEISELVRYVNNTRPLLTEIPTQDLQDFVTRCLSHAPDREALADLVRTAVPPPVGRRSLVPLSEFLRFATRQGGFLASDISTIYYNLDHNNRTGHLKQAFYAVQRFFQENPEHIRPVVRLTNDSPFEIQQSHDLLADWIAFFAAYESESDQAFDYSFRILRGYLTPQFGGTRLGGGGGDYPFKLVWPVLARMMST